jgi:hypothetical protein
MAASRILFQQPQFYLYTGACLSPSSNKTLFPYLVARYLQKNASFFQKEALKNQYFFLNFSREEETMLFFKPF